MSTTAAVSNEQLCARIRAGENEADNMLQLYEQNRGLIYTIARKYSGYAEMEDLQQEGYIGLCEAVRHYDPEQGTSFMNYAGYWIRQTMQRYIDNCSGVVRLPVHAREWIRKYNRTVRDYRRECGCDPPERALCALLGVRREELHKIQKNACMVKIRSLSEPIGGEDDDITLQDAVSSGEDPATDVIREIDRETMKGELWLAVDQLPDRLPAVVRGRYQEGKNLKEIGGELGVNYQRAHELERKAFRLLRTERRGGKLRRYCEEYLTAAPVHYRSVRRFNETWTSITEWDALRELEGWQQDVTRKC